LLRLELAKEMATGPFVELGLGMPRGGRNATNRGCPTDAASAGRAGPSEAASARG